MDEAGFDQRVFDEDEEAQVKVALEQAYLMRPMRSAWRYDPKDAPNGKPMCAHEVNSIRLIIAQRDDDEWWLITRDGELQPLEGIAMWAPLESALG
ncbi:hypothetical protein [Vitreimonas flagellata]|uniref:hypothetical protein n=1 Tax=Vitreimonas flagellata TaxID=2560861 RepID=UPI0010754012|nr:hypothetical protein [Vitreimonas flagellata]